MANERESFENIDDYQITINIEEKKLSIKLLQKNDEELFEKSFTADDLLNCGFNKKQSSNFDTIKRLIGIAFENKDGLKCIVKKHNHKNTILFITNDHDLYPMEVEMKLTKIERKKNDIEHKEQIEEKDEEKVQLHAVHGADRFSFIRELSHTLQGRIYLVMDKNTNKHCVVKEAWKELVHSGRSRSNTRVAEDFVRERNILMQLTSKGAPDSLIRGIDEWDDEKCYFVVMEACHGELFEYINSVHRGKEYMEYTLKQCHPLKEQKALKRPNKWIENVTFMFRQLCEGVSWMHEHGYCHLDLSLENTMLADADSHRIKIIDYGLTKKFENGNFTHRARVGKVSYMCPEAYARTKYDARSADIYCLGIMLFMMLVGAPIYQYPIKQCAPFHYTMTGRLKEILVHWKRLNIVTEDALDLINKILRYENKRITMEQIFEHPFMNIIEDEEDDLVNDVVQVIEEKDEEENDESDGSVHGLDSEDDDDKCNDESVHGLDSNESDNNNEVNNDNKEEEIERLKQKLATLKQKEAEKENKKKLEAKKMWQLAAIYAKKEQKRPCDQDDEKNIAEEKIMDEIEKRYDKLFIKEFAFISITFDYFYSLPLTFTYSLLVVTLQHLLSHFVTLITGMLYINSLFLQSDHI